MSESISTSPSNVIRFPGTTRPETGPGPISGPTAGPISGPMLAKIGKMASAYRSDFDWGVYDRLHERFTDKPVRGGVVFKSTFKLINHHSSCTQCHYALEIDAYGRGCFHDCSYCYAKAQLTMHGYWNRPMPFPIDLAEVHKILYTVFETDKRSKWRDVIGKRVPVRIGCMSDSFLWIDKKYGVALELLKLLKFYRYPYVIATRSDLAADDAYIEAMDPDLAAVQFSITGTNDRLTRIIEPGAPSLLRRFKALKKIREAGIWTTARLNPLFPTYPDGYFSDPEYYKAAFGARKDAPKFDLFDINRIDEFIDQLIEHKVPTLMPGFVRLAPTAIKSISQSSGVDFAKFYKPKFFALKGDKRYSDREIRYYYELIHKKCQEAGIRFTTCYIGNGEKDFYQYQDMWSNKSDCCDALGKVKDFTLTSHAIPWETRIKHAPCKDSARAAQREAESYAKTHAHNGANELNS